MHLVNREWKERTSTKAVPIYEKTATINKLPEYRVRDDLTLPYPQELDAQLSKFFVGAHYKFRSENLGCCRCKGIRK